MICRKLRIALAMMIMCAALSATGLAATGNNITANVDNGTPAMITNDNAVKILNNNAGTLEVMNNAGPNWTNNTTITVNQGLETNVCKDNPNDLINTMAANSFPLINGAVIVGNGNGGNTPNTMISLC